MSYYIYKAALKLKQTSQRHYNTSWVKTCGGVGQNTDFTIRNGSGRISFPNIITCRHNLL